MKNTINIKIEYNVCYKMQWDFWDCMLNIVFSVSENIFMDDYTSLPA